jgi:L-threonylcarbamoyladenylate synthase
VSALPHVVILPFGDEAVERAAATLQSGGLVAFPTETVYGLGARADRSEAVKRIYAAKGRPAENPSIVHAATAESAFELTDEVPPTARALAARHWPGPLTMVLRARPSAVASEVMAGGSTVALRVPRHPAAHAILAAVGLPIAAPSANRSNAISPTTAAHVAASLGDAVELIVDAGPTGFGIESTIVDLASDPPKLLRRGSVSFAELAVDLPNLVDRADVVTESGARPAAPGAYARHYAPTTELRLAASDDVARVAGEAIARGRAVGCLLITSPSPVGARAIERLPHDAAEYARDLYAALHRLDAAACDILIAEELPPEPSWAAVRDRLRRASSR